jgi:hypothetical protein
MINDDIITTFGNEYTVCVKGQEFDTSGYFLTLSGKGWAIHPRDFARLCWSEQNKTFYWEPQNSDRTKEYFAACRYQNRDEAEKIARELILRNEPLAYMLWEDRECVGGKPSC